MSNKNKIYLHPEDRCAVIKFIDYVRLQKSKPTNPKIEISARYVAEYVGINPDVDNARLANKFDSLLEQKIIK